MTSPYIEHIQYFIDGSSPHSVEMQIISVKQLVSSFQSLVNYAQFPPNNSYLTRVLKNIPLCSRFVYNDVHSSNDGSTMLNFPFYIARQGCKHDFLKGGKCLRVCFSIMAV